MMGLRMHSRMPRAITPSSGTDSSTSLSITLVNLSLSCTVLSSGNELSVRKELR